MEFIDFSDIQVTGGFWKQKQDMNRNSTVKAVYDRFSQSNRFDALKCDWKARGEYDAHIYWDSDVAKWIEGVSYLLAQERNCQLEEIIDEAIGNILKNARQSGYFNSYYLAAHPGESFQNRNDHELYCLGHLIEAAVAYDKATGKDAFLKAMCKYADHVEQVFKTEKTASFVTPGHPELELALVKLYKHTGQKRYLELAKFFIDQHGNCADADPEAYYLDWATLLYNQDELPLRERSTMDGHCVRALYLLCGAADIADIYGDSQLAQACKRCYQNAVEKRMYITGGLGSTHRGEAFTIDYHLPNRTAYAETCAAISLALFARRMQKLEVNASFADTVERAMYNGVLSGVSMDGKSFFYENPLCIDPDFNDVNPATTYKERYPITQRLELFRCSCCPPNMVRFLASIAGLMYSYDGDTLYVDQYMDSVTQNDRFYIRQTTRYPAAGTVEITCQCAQKYVALRIPAWCRSFSLNHGYTMKNGYAVIENPGELTVRLELELTVQRIAANRRIHENAGKVAVMRGPVVYCGEGVDNGADLCSVLIPGDAVFTLEEEAFLLPSLKVSAYRPRETECLYYTAGEDYEPVELKLIPYYAFANRGTTEMVVWFNRAF